MRRAPARAIMRSMGRGLLAAALCLAGAAAPPAREFAFRHERILGASLDLLVRAPDAAAAEACETAVLDEIERLRRILSAYDPSSEISRLNASTESVSASPELLEVLALCERWRLKSGGAFNAGVGSLSAGPAAETGRGTARRLSPGPLTVDAVATGWIIDRAVAAARAKVPAVEGVLLDIGGDILGCGRTPWRIGVADPRRSEENAPLLALVDLRGRAITSSSNAHRRHILDPRTGLPAQGVAGSTVVAPDAATADALATILCVLAPGEGLRLVSTIPGAECLVMAAGGSLHASPGWGALAVPPAPAQEKALWPEGHQVTITLDLAEKPPGKSYRRPYVAVWIENAEGKPVRMIEAWGRSKKYTPTLTAWWSFAKDNPERVKAVSRATRAGGRYALAWDGRDDAGKPLPPGTYAVRVEVHREHGSHIKDMAAKIECGERPATAEIKPNTEVGGVKIQYGPAEK
jgi:thiamine biosynthesis lipoprotein ApbE